VTFEWDPTGFGGFQLRRNFDTRAITIALPEKVFQLATLLNVMHKPAEDDKFGPPAITKEDLDEIDFDRTNDKLTADQKLCQKATGLLTWIAQVRLDISFFARKCSRVMSAPKAEPVLKVLRAITLALLKKPHMGKTFSQSPGVTDLEIIKSSKVAFDADKVAPEAFEIVNDATFSDKTNMSVGSAAYMLMGAAITVDVTSIPGTPLSSTESEKYMEAVAMARGIGYTNLLTEMDMPQPKPIRMWGDNRISVELALDARSGKGSTHFARRIAFTQGMCKGDDEDPAEYLPAHIPTEKNTVDFFGKLVNAARYRMSVYYNMGTLMEVPPSAADLARAMAAYDAANSLE
jgi:hypothetical protein